MRESKFIKVVNANVHNLKNVTVSIPKNSLTTITGPSGSGKSSLAFDTIYVEGQRRYIESLSSYARQFLGQFSPPDVESITGLSPSIAINQKTKVVNPRSTVGTITEIYDYMRILFARVGTLYCLEEGDEVKKYTPPKIVGEILELGPKTKVMILSPIVYKKKEELKAHISKFFSLGFYRYRVDGEIQIFEEDSLGAIKGNPSIEVIVDRIVVKKGITKRITDSVEYALKIGGGEMIVSTPKEDFFYSEKNVSKRSRRIYPDLEPRLFSFNSPQGACPRCNGLGQSKSFSPEKMIHDENLSILNGAVPVLNRKNSFFFKMAQSMAREEKVDLSLPLKDLPDFFLKNLFEGSSKAYTYFFRSKSSRFRFSKRFPGAVKWFEKKYRETSSMRLRTSLESYMDIKECPECEGLRLNPTALGTKIEARNIMDICGLSIHDAFSVFQSPRA